jgi:NAD(P)-dependent dehydrogenase (short-subunit alcohol dehydrogenase family)
MNRLLDKTALIVGADPITLGIATRYAAEGASVTIASGAASLKDAATMDGVKTIEISDANSAADKAAIRAAAGACLDILVLGGADIPAVKDWTPVAALSLDRLRETENSMVARSLIAVQACEAALRAGGNASVIFLHSPAGYYSEGGWSDYTISYHARHGLMRAVAAEWGPVRANMLVPFADTPGFQAVRARNPAEVDFRVTTTAMKRVGDVVKDIGGAAVFLGSDDTQYVTGMMVFADGGAFLIQPVLETSTMEAAS